jgi:16S rRNA (guanine1207-N2)-methyltransferase
MVEAVYGAPPPALVEVEPGALQLSPFSPGAEAIEALAPGSLDRVSILAPPGTLERRYVVALALKALKPGGELVVLAPKDKGGSRLKKELQAFGLAVEEWSKAHHRIARVERPETLEGLEAAIAEGGPRLVPALGLWSQPGVFSWDRPDPGSLLLIDKLPPLKGDGADLGCGAGLLSLAVLKSPAVTSLAMVDLDRRAVEAARRNVADPRAQIRWADATLTELSGLDFVVMNPPFHDGGAEDKGLGLAFISAAAKALRKGGTLWMVANRHLPYEAGLVARFAKVTVAAEAQGYKLFEAVK